MTPIACLMSHQGLPFSCVVLGMSTTRNVMNRSIATGQQTALANTFLLMWPSVSHLVELRDMVNFECHNIE
jgi:uncharacterized protein YejL (UPF0352 family)